MLKVFTVLIFTGDCGEGDSWAHKLPLTEKDCEKNYSCVLYEYVIF